MIPPTTSVHQEPIDDQVSDTVPCGGVNGCRCWFWVRDAGDLFDMEMLIRGLDLHQRMNQKATSTFPQFGQLA